jgi:hypothetical protein
MAVLADEPMVPKLLNGLCRTTFVRDSPLLIADRVLFAKADPRDPEVGSTDGECESSGCRVTLEDNDRSSVSWSSKRSPPEVTDIGYVPDTSVVEGSGKSNFLQPHKTRSRRNSASPPMPSNLDGSHQSLD